MARPGGEYSPLQRAAPGDGGRQQETGDSRVVGPFDVGGFGAFQPDGHRLRRSPDRQTHACEFVTGQGGKSHRLCDSLISKLAFGSAVIEAMP